jgi:hypothetical protein
VKPVELKSLSKAELQKESKYSILSNSNQYTKLKNLLERLKRDEYDNSERIKWLNTYRYYLFEEAEEDI